MLSKPLYKRILVIDFETRWDRKDYTLSKMTTEQYIRDERFKAFGMCMKFLNDEEPAEWVPHDRIPDVLKTYNWNNTAVLAHNAQFDVAILSWVYGVKPCFVFDSLSMARALRGIEVGNSLAKLADEYGLPPKGNAVHSTDGLLELTPEIEKELADYCAHDTYLCEEVFKRLVQGYPAKELRLIDMTLKMFINPVLELDKEMLNAAITEEKTRRTNLLTKLGIEETALASNQQFADVLLSMGVTPPTKVSKTTGREALALAKNDALFQALLNSDNEDVALLCEARLAVKSTLERTRAQRFLDISSRGRLPVPLNYYGAHTGRWSASKGSGLNLQNLKRGSFLRKAIMAPEGYMLVVCDLAQIEPRVLAWLAGYDVMLDIFRAGGDPYAAFGAQMFGIPGLSKDSHPDLRQSAKSALLGAGYGLGWAAFAAQLLTGFLGAPPTRYDKTFAKQLGADAEYVQKFTDWEVNLEKLADIPHNCTDQELFVHAVATKKIIDKYRDAADPVVQFWSICQN
jgi:DNA polymerase I-like protein with 3'-5' exonuclease and polymerase domains